MKPSPHVVNRRYFLRAAGISLALPLLESLSTRVLGAGLGVASKPGTAIGATRPKRLVAIGNMLGFYQPEFFPTATGRDFALPSLLQPLAPHRPDFSLFSGLDHGLKGGHFAIHSYLSGVRSMDAKSMPEGNISVDQRAAETIGGGGAASIRRVPWTGSCGGNGNVMMSGKLVGLAYFCSRSSKPPFA